jgi:hypothetical protein
MLSHVYTPRGNGESQIEEHTQMAKKKTLKRGKKLSGTKTLRKAGIPSTN